MDVLLLTPVDLEEEDEPWPAWSVDGSWDGEEASPVHASVPAAAPVQDVCPVGFLLHFLLRCCAAADVALRFVLRPVSPLLAGWGLRLMGHLLRPGSSLERPPSLDVWARPAPFESTLRGKLASWL